MKRALFPGSFDPFTLGHEDLVRRSLCLFEEVWIGLALSAEKKALSTPAARKAWVEKCFPKDPRVQVHLYDGLTVDFMREKQISFMVRGLRSSSDFEFESILNGVNKKLYPEHEVIFLPSSIDLTHVHSKFVRELITHQKSLAGFVPEVIRLDLERHFGIR